jgi:hypothetical protein
MRVSAQTRPMWTALVCVPLLFIAIATLQVRIDAKTRSTAQLREELLFRSGPTIKKLSLGYDSLLADIYWTRAVQYYGARVATPGANFDLLWPLLDLTTTLDPHLIPAYRFGAIFLSEPGEVGANRPDLAIQLAKRGIAANPSEWRLGTDLGFLYYWRLKDYPNAAAAYLQASKNPKAPAWIKLLAARIAEKGGSFETSRAIWSELFESTKDPIIKKDALAEEYRKRFGRYPASVEEMLSAGLLTGIPVDPAGFPYVLGATGKSHLNPASPVVILPESKGPTQ